MQIRHLDAPVSLLESLASCGHIALKRLPKHLNLGPVEQKTKESKRIHAEGAGLLGNWYNQLARVVKNDTPARLVYNFDRAWRRQI